MQINLVNSNKTICTNCSLFFMFFFFIHNSLISKSKSCALYYTHKTAIAGSVYAHTPKNIVLSKNLPSYIIAIGGNTQQPKSKVISNFYRKALGKIYSTLFFKNTGYFNIATRYKNFNFQLNSHHKINKYATGREPPT